MLKCFFTIFGEILINIFGDFFSEGKKWKHFHQVLWKFWGITKFGEKSCVDNVTKFCETKCCDIIFTKFGEILINFTKLGENSVVC